MEINEEMTISKIPGFVRSYIYEDCVEDDPELCEQIESPNDLSNDLNLIEDLDGDSLMMLSLLREITKTFQIEVDLDELGRKLIHHPANTVGEIIEMAELLVTKGPEAFS
ncbi:MAG: acyl carrier protein [Gammaproteobacteria bacterium]|nr:acyl carrier protein [Gammaproteobacteria bacterium]